MESQNGDQDYWPYIGVPQWRSYEVPRSLHTSTQPGKGGLTGSQFAPSFHTALSGQPNFQHPFHGPLGAMTDVETEICQLPAQYREVYAEGAHRLGPTAALDQSTFPTCPPLGSFPSGNIIQNSRTGDPFDRSLEETFMWPQGNSHRQQAYSFGSDSFGNSDNGYNWQPDDSYTTPPGSQWTDHPFPRTPSPGSGNHDSPGLPGTPYLERMGAYVAEEDPLPPGISNWSSDIHFTRRNGHAQATQETKSSTQSYYYSYGQSLLLKIGGKSTLILVSEGRKLENIISERRSCRRIAD